MAGVQTICPISEYAFAELLPNDDGYDVLRIKSPPFGAIYRVTGSAKALLDAGTSGTEAARLATWIIDQHRLGVIEPEVSSVVVSQVADAGPLPIGVRAERLIRFLGSRISRIGGSLAWGLPYMASDEFLADAKVNRISASLWTECVDEEELSALVDYGVAQGHVLLSLGGSHISLTIVGWQVLEQLELAKSSTDQAFVAMWFGSEVSSAYEDGIAPAIRDAGYAPMRIDQKEHANRIDDEIIAEIRRSRFVVADFTCGVVDDGGKSTAIPRGGVYYEAGFAQGLGIPVIWMCREDHINHVHFDTRQFNHITWTDAADLRGKLKNRIGAVLGDGPNVQR